uniref:Uncharacterized protein n=1 Tax=virus sp. ctpeS3 TaxID=2826815 RepID=A0A8S5R9K8_9VIRU|nr:MAG TPA: hypothetical protein [virus sp. ctpeS3]
MCGGMSKRYEMSIAKRNTEKALLGGHYEKVSLSCVVQIHTTSIICRLSASCYILNSGCVMLTCFT